MLIASIDARTFSVSHFSQRAMPSELAGQCGADCWGIFFTFSDSMDAALGGGEGRELVSVSARNWGLAPDFLGEWFFAFALNLHPL
jgi:hypothetical protein